MPRMPFAVCACLLFAACAITTIAEETSGQDDRSALYDRISFTNINVSTNVRVGPSALALPRQAGTTVRAGEVNLRTNVSPVSSVQQSEVLFRTNIQPADGVLIQPHELIVPALEAQEIRAQPSLLAVPERSVALSGSQELVLRTNAAPANRIAATPAGLISRVEGQPVVRAEALLLRTDIAAPTVLRSLPVSLGVPATEGPQLRAREAALAFFPFRELPASCIDAALASNTLSDAGNAAATNIPWLREDLAWLIRSRMFEPEAHDAFKALLRIDASGVVSKDVEGICSWATNTAGGRYEEALLYNAAYYLYRTMEYAAALKYTEKLSARYTNHADHVVLLRASSFIGQGKHDAALAELAKFGTDFVGSPLLPRARFLTAWVYVYSRKPDMAKPILEEMALEPEGEYRQRAVELLNTIAQQQARKKPARSRRR